MLEQAAIATPFVTQIQVRFSDTDALGHVNNASYAQYAETARLDLFASFEVKVSAIILAHLGIQYRQQILLGDHVSVNTFVSFIGRTSITLEQHVLAGDQVAAEVTSVVVFFGYQEREKREVPQSLRERIRSSPYFRPQMGRRLIRE